MIVNQKWRFCCCRSGAFSTAETAAGGKIGISAMNFLCVNVQG